MDQRLKLLQDIKPLQESIEKKLPKIWLSNFFDMASKAQAPKEKWDKLGPVKNFKLLFTKEH